MVSFKTDNSASEQSTPHRHLPGTLHGSLNHSHSHSSHQQLQRQHESTLPTRHTPPTHTPNYSTVPRSGCAIHPRLEQPVTSSTAGMDDKKVVQAAPSVASGPQVRTKSVLDGSGVGASISGLRRRNGPQPGLRSPAAKRPLSAPVALQGWLHKQGSEGLMLWKKRWFVLSEYCLFYYKGPEEEKLLGSILLPSYRVTVCKPEDKVNKKFAFKAEHANMRTYHFAADTREAMNQWVNILTLATLLQDPNPGGGDAPAALDLAGPADGDRSARPSVSSISSILNQSADDSDSGFHGFQSRDDPSHASNNNSSPNSANTASFPNLSGSNSNSIGNPNININNNNTSNNNNSSVNSPEHGLEDSQPHQPLVNGWIQPPGQFGQPSTSQQQYGHVLPGPGQHQQHQHHHQQSQFNHQQQQQHLQHQQHVQQQHQSMMMMHQHVARPQHSNQHQPGPSNVNQSVSQIPPRNFGQPVYANAPPKPRRLTDGSTDYSAPSPDSDFRKSPTSTSNVRQTTKSPMSDYERGNAIYASRLAQQQQPPPPQPTLRTDKSGLNYGYGHGQGGERRTPDGYGRGGKSRTGRVNGDYEDVYGTAPPLYQRPAGPVGYTKSPAPVPIPIPVYGQHQQNSQATCLAVSPSNVPIMRQPRAQPPPRPHSADFLEYEATRKPNQQLSNDAGSLTTSQQRRPQRPKSSMDVVNPTDAPPASDGYFYSEETYAAQMRQSAVYLHQTPQHHQQQRNQSLSRATTPCKTNSIRSDADADSNNSGSIAETPCPAVRKSQRDDSHRQHPLATQSLQRYTESSSNDAMLRRSLRERSYDPNESRDSLIHGEAGTVPRRMPREMDSSATACAGRLLGESPSAQTCHPLHAGPRRWSEQQFARSASARLPRTRYANDQRDETEYGERSPAHGSRDGERRIQQREESMKRLLEWKQRMLQSPLTRKPGAGSSNGGGSAGGASAQNELSSYYKRQALLDLAAHEATVAEARHSRRRDDAGHRPHARSKSTDGRRSAATNVSRYNSYSSDDEELDDVRRKRTRRPSHAGRTPRHFVEDAPTIVTNPAASASTGSSATSSCHHRIVNQSSAGRMTPPKARDHNPGRSSQDNRRANVGGIPPDAGYEEVSFPPIYQRDYTISVSSNRPPSSTDSASTETLRVKTPKKPSGILKTPMNYATNRSSASETPRLTTLPGYVTGESWQIQKNVQWDANDDEKQSWDGKIDETEVIKEFSYQYIKPEDVEDGKVQMDDVPTTPEPKNLVQSRIRTFETSMDESAPARDPSSMQEPLKLSPPQSTEAHVSKIDPARSNPAKIRESALASVAENLERSAESKSEDSGDSCRDQPADGGKSVKDLLADFERKSQQVRRQEDDKREEVKHRGVFSDTETLLYDTGSDLDQPDRSDGDDELYQTINKRNDEKSDYGTLKKNQRSGGTMDHRNSNISREPTKNSTINDYGASTNSEAFARLSMTESMVTHGDDLSAETGNLEEMNTEEHYLPMTPRKSVLDVNIEDRSNPTMIESLFANLRSEESSYVEMAQNGMGNSILVPVDPTKHNPDDYSTLDTQHYEFVCVADNKVEPVYMEVAHLTDKDDKQSGKGSKKRDSAIQTRPDLPDILTALKSDSSDADDESSKDLESIDAPRHPRFSLSDTFRPASYYLGVSRTMIAELHDSSDSELVSPPPIPTSPPPLDDLDSLDLQDSMDVKKTSDPQKSRNSPKWNKPAGQVESRSSPSRFSEATISSTFRDSRISLESVSGSDSLELRNPDEEARHRQLKRRPVSDEVCEVLDSLDELESLGSRFDGASIDLDQYLEELQARDAFNVDLYAKDLSYNSIYGLNENMIVADKLHKTNSQDMNVKMALASNTLDQPFQHGRRGKTSSASSLPSMRVSDAPPSHQHSQSFTGDTHYENVAGFSPLRGSPAVRVEEEQLRQFCDQIGRHSRESSYSLATVGPSDSASTSHRRPNSAQSTSVTSPSSGINSQQHSGSTIRHHARSASHDTPRTAMSTNHRPSSSQDSTFYPTLHQNQRTSPAAPYSPGLARTGHQQRPNETDQSGAPYYYSDLQVSVSNIDAQLNRHSVGHTTRLPQLNNQRDDSVMNKRNDIGRLVNPITRQLPRRIEVVDIDEARRIAAELRKSSSHYLAESKHAMLDRKNFYESDTLRRAKSTDPLPNDGLPDVSSVNIYPLGLRDKSNSQMNLDLDDVTPELVEHMAQPSHRRSRSLEGLLDDVGLQNLVEQRNRANRVSSVPPMRTQHEVDEPPPMPVGTGFTPISVEDANYGEGEDPWEQDALWRESLRRVSLRQARSLDNLDNSARTPEVVRPDSRTRAKITRGATYVNDSVAIQRQQDAGHVRNENDDDGSYERLTMNRRTAEDYVWDPENEAYRRRDGRGVGIAKKHFLSEGNLPPTVAGGPSNKRTSTSTSGSFELDREKLRQWDLVSSACLLQEQQRNSMAESGRGLPVAEDGREGNADVGSGERTTTTTTAMMMMMGSKTGRENDDKDERGIDDRSGGSGELRREGENGIERDDDEGADGCGGRAAGEWLFTTGGAGLYRK